MDTGLPSRQIAAACRAITDGGWHAGGISSRAMDPIRLPLAVREGAVSGQLREDVAPALEPALRTWILQGAKMLELAQAQHILIRLELVLPAEYRQHYEQQLKDAEQRQAEVLAEWEEGQANAKAAQRNAAAVSMFVPATLPPAIPSPVTPYARFLAYGTSSGQVYFVIDELLAELCVEPLAPDATVFTVARKGSALLRTRKITTTLTALLEAGRSAYEVCPDRRGLVRRIPAALSEATATAAAIAVATGAAQAAEYLAKAQAALIALRPDYGLSYAQAIRAVEAVANPLLIPRDQEPTLTKARNHLRDSATYEFALPDRTGAPGSVTVVIEMLTALCRGHSDRHAGGPNNAPVTREGAESAFALAVSLVTMFSSGAVRRTS